jgi:hypothetical protein
MAAFIHSDVYDNGLVTLEAATFLHILSSQPAVFADVATYTLGNNASPVVAPPTTRSNGGREVVVAAISGGSVTGSGTAGFFALVDGTRLLAAGPLSAPQAVVTGNTFSLPSFTIGIPSPA